ncbi:MAG: hypothetical protein L0Y71_07695 [Gemmataceae bacterium]|nr:hypothetical protein [Gemmataceae bacterium]
MTQPGDVRDPSVPASPGAARPGAARGFLRWVCTKNPFYVLSAGLFLAGLRISFGDPTLAEDTWFMMGGLAGYTLLLAGAACLLVRFATVWDDVRTVLLLVVLMFLATSVTFDEVLVLTPERGVACGVLGFMFAVVVSEGILRAIRLRLPGWFRMPYYLILALFFVYPLALRPFLHEPHSPTLLWGLFGFSPAAGLLFLTLLPAIRRGPDHVRGNGSPWPFPLYPWSLFVFLAMAVVGRSILLCWSMHLLGNGDNERLIFGPYFLVPFGFALAILVLEMAIVSGRRDVLGVALALPLGLVILAFTGHRADPVYGEFLDVFARGLGALPPYVTVVGATAFYLYAASRRVAFALDGLTAALLILSIVAPNTLLLDDLVAPRPLPLTAVAVVQLAIGLARWASWRCVLGSLAAVAAIAPLADVLTPSLQTAVAFHLALAALLVLAALFDDWFARTVRVVGSAVIVWLSLGTLLGGEAAGLPAWAVWVYPLGMAMFLFAYGKWLRHVFAQGSAGVILAAWLLTGVWHGYATLRQRIAGLDLLVASLVLLGVAVLISLSKGGVLSRWKPAWRGASPPAVD